MPRPPKGDFEKFIKYDRRGHDSMILRYGARMISKKVEDQDRYFVVNILY